MSSKFLQLTILISALYLYSGFAAAAVSERGLVGYWSFNEGTGDRAGDASGQGNYVVLANGPVWANGRLGKALNFGSTDNIVNVGSLATLDNLPAITFSAWVFPRDYGPSNITRFVTKRGNPEASGWHLGTQLSGGDVGRIDFTVDYSTTDLQRVAASGNLPLNRWTYLTATWDGTASYTGIKIYSNGVEVNSYNTNTSGAGSRVDDSAQNLVIGNNELLARDYNGLLDEVRVYNRALTAQEVKQLYLSGQTKQ